MINTVLFSVICLFSGFEHTKYLTFVLVHLRLYCLVNGDVDVLWFLAPFLFIGGLLGVSSVDIFLL